MWFTYCFENSRSFYGFKFTNFFHIILTLYFYDIFTLFLYFFLYNTHCRILFFRHVTDIFWRTQFSLILLFIFFIFRRVNKCNLWILNESFMWGKAQQENLHIITLLSQQWIKEISRCRRRRYEFFKYFLNGRRGMCIFRLNTVLKKTRSG